MNEKIAKELEEIWRKDNNTYIDNYKDKSEKLLTLYKKLNSIEGLTVINVDGKLLFKFLHPNDKFYEEKFHITLSAWDEKAELENGPRASAEVRVKFMDLVTELSKVYFVNNVTFGYPVSNGAIVDSKKIADKSVRLEFDLLLPR